MKIKQYAFSLLLIFSLSIQAQRYKTEVFSSVDVSSGINYGSAPAWSTFPISLAMDIYEPSGGYRNQQTFNDIGPWRLFYGWL